MKFLLKISLFMALILISKLTKESEETATVTSETNRNSTTLTLYDQQGNPLDKLDEVENERARTIYY
jgi:hypothetical protein